MTVDAIVYRLTHPEPDDQGRLWIRLGDSELKDRGLAQALEKSAISSDPGQIQHFELRGKQVTDVGVRDVVGRYPGLQSLDLSDTQVTDVGVRVIVERCPGLIWLKLSRTQVTDVGVRVIVERCPGIELLWLVKTQVTDTGVGEWARCSDLKELNLGGTQVTDAGLMAVAQWCPNLQNLYVWQTRVTDAGLMAMIRMRTGYRRLSLSGTQVTDVGVAAVVRRCFSLQWLHLNNTSVTDVGVVAVAEYCHGLQTLNLLDTLVTDVGVVAVAEHCHGLQTLNLSNASVTDVGVVAVAEHCPGLQTLDLSGTLVTDVGVRVVVERLSQLKGLSLHECRALRLPEELVGFTSHVAELRAYFARVKDGKRQLNEAKMIVVGNEAVGKSALVKYLISGKPCENSGKTPGIEIHEKIDVSKWNTKAGDLRLNVWDFGGQEVLTETHKLFLTSRALYLVVLEARRENTVDAEAELHHWMRSIRHRSGEPVPVIVVVNKAEHPHELRLDETRLAKEYDVVAFIRTSCLDPKKHPEGGKGIEELRQTILDTVRQHIPHVQDWFPVSYYQVKEELEQIASSEFVLSPQRYATICACERNGIIEEAEQESLLALLDRIGVVIRHTSNNLLDPNWLTTAIYRVLTHSDVVKANGEFSKDDLGKLLKDIPEAVKRYPKHRWQYIVDQTVECGLSFELPDQSGCYLMPEQLPPNEPPLKWNETQCLRFRYDYDDLPKGLLPRFIVEMHRYLGTPRTAWANGVVLKINQCDVLVRADRKNRRVLIFVDGPKAERRETLFLVREGLVWVHSRFDELKPKPMVPVDVPGELDAAIEYEVLVDCERLGVKQIPVKGKLFNVSEVLGSVGWEPVIRDADQQRTLFDEEDSGRLRSSVRRRGRPVQNATSDEHIFAAWSTGQYATYAALARELKFMVRDAKNGGQKPNSELVKLAVDRVRKRRNKSSESEGCQEE